MYSYLLAYRIFVFLDTVLYSCIALSPRLPYLHRILNTKKTSLFGLVFLICLSFIEFNALFPFRNQQNRLRLISGDIIVYSSILRVPLLSLHHSCIKLLKLLRFFLVFAYIAYLLNFGASTI